MKKILSLVAVLGIALAAALWLAPEPALGSGGAGGGGSSTASKLANPTVLGTDSATAPTGGTIRGGNATGGTANVSGGTVTIQCGKSTGNGDSQCVFQMSPAGTPGATGVNAPVTWLQTSNTNTSTISSQSVNVASAGVWRHNGAFVPAGITMIADFSANGHNVGSIAVLGLQAAATFTAHAGGGQASATLVCGTQTTNDVTTVGTAADSVKLPGAGNNFFCIVRNSGANAMALFPQTGESLCVAGGACLAANTSTSVAANAEIWCWAKSASAWACR